MLGTIHDLAVYADEAVYAARRSLLIWLFQPKLRALKHLVTHEEFVRVARPISRYDVREADRQLRSVLTSLVGHDPELHRQRLRLLRRWDQTIRRVGSGGIDNVQRMFDKFSPHFDLR